MSDDPVRRLILILGGARSGKSAYAEALAASVARARIVLYVATATASDEEMRERIMAHQANRPPHWRTVEAPLDPTSALERALAQNPAPVVLLDCITLLAANLLLDDAPHEGEVDATAGAARLDDAIDALLALYERSQFTLIVVSNEVGMGVVPPYPLGRAYRDILGRANTRLARAADATLLMIAGAPVEISTLTGAWEARRRELFPDDEH
ncbi:MAG TPA: bifunctional adenosylcobinamide kinase/adenosylcobinamide-phosphate guanylyltransferase [Ktedonobacterales bacterium]|jgi:adenosylcobinamide kinase / adenosylcobinamide-phosphate guanylyltransferase|nr:bifunctional adenosylcobinamide kinase/adenosylcobinamide-phosphate guanylyltransferase [Ktedonobacterales bacterium]